MVCHGLRKRWDLYGYFFTYKKVGANTFSIVTGRDLDIFNIMF